MAVATKGESSTTCLYANTSSAEFPSTNETSNASSDDLDELRLRAIAD